MHGVVGRVLKEIGDAGEGDTRGRGGFGEEHTAGHERVEAILLIELVHGGGEARAAGFSIEAGKEVEGMQAAGDDAAEPDADVEGPLICRALRTEVPQLYERVDEGLTVLALDDGDGPGPCGSGRGFRSGFGRRGGSGREEFDEERDVGGPEVSGAEPQGGLMQELERDGAGPFDGAKLGRQNVAVADGSGAVEGGVMEVFTAEPMPEFFSADAAPDAVHLLAAEGEQLAHRADVVPVQALLHACADSGQVAEPEPAERRHEDIGREGDEAVGLVHVGGDFGEITVRRESDGAAKSVPRVIADGLLDGARESEGVEERLFAAHQIDCHFIDGQHSGDRSATLDGADDLVVVLDVELVTALDYDEARAEAFCLADLGSGLDAEGFGLIAGGDGAGSVGHDGDDDDGAVAKLGAELLFDGGEVGVEVKEKPANKR